MPGIPSEIDASKAKERLANAISRLENAISARDKKLAFEEKVRGQVIKELDSYIANLATLLNAKKK